MIKVAIITSTGGSVMNAVLKLPYMQDRICTVISDRKCGAIGIAQENGITAKLYITHDAQVFSDQLGEFFTQAPHDLIISFYTKLFRGNLLEQLQGKFINFHPSILPACPGMDGFGDTIKSGARFIGATVHLIDNGADTGFPIIQSALPFNPHLSLAENRHDVFIAQCKMLIQTVKWYEDGRISMDESGRPCLAGAQYLAGEFAPNLDFPPAIQFTP
jgi:phosphoribosylglycinamide formyltransferase-1